MSDSLVIIQQQPVVNLSEQLHKLCTRTTTHVVDESLTDITLLDINNSHANDIDHRHHRNMIQQFMLTRFPCSLEEQEQQQHQQDGNAGCEATEKTTTTTTTRVTTSGHTLHNNNNNNNAPFNNNKVVTIYRSQILSLKYEQMRNKLAQKITLQQIDALHDRLIAITCRLKKWTHSVTKLFMHDIIMESFKVSGVKNNRIKFSMDDDLCVNSDCQIHHDDNNNNNNNNYSSTTTTTTTTLAIIGGKVDFMFFLEEEDEETEANDHSCCPIGIIEIQEEGDLERSKASLFMKMLATVSNDGSNNNRVMWGAVASIDSCHFYLLIGDTFTFIMNSHITVAQTGTDVIQTKRELRSLIATVSCMLQQTLA